MRDNVSIVLGSGSDAAHRARVTGTGGGGGIITGEQAERLWAFLAARGGRLDLAPSNAPRFTFTNVLYYLGGVHAELCAV